MKKKSCLKGRQFSVKASSEEIAQNVFPAKRIRMVCRPLQSASSSSSDVLRGISALQELRCLQEKW